MTATDHEGFLAAICADPHDAGLRLIYADWLEEHGEEARSEFIRVQCELAAGDFRCTCTCEYEHGIGCPASRVASLRRREGELLAGGRDYEWFFPRGLLMSECRWEFRRGFVEVVSCTCADWLQYGPAIVRCQPVCEVKLTDLHAVWDRTGWGLENAPAWARGPHEGLPALPPLEDPS